jgi:hypothetical protein
LKNVTLNDGLTTINGYAFNDCTDLEVVYIPTSVTSLDENAFSHTRLIYLTPSPSYAPTLEPTCVPTHAPSYAPTYAPTYEFPPTCVPTHAPTYAPTYIYAPTYAPTQTPTNLNAYTTDEGEKDTAYVLYITLPIVFFAFMIIGACLYYKRRTKEIIIPVIDDNDDNELESAYKAEENEDYVSGTTLNDEIPQENTLVVKNTRRIVRRRDNQVFTHVENFVSK